ncbi:MAG TPA: dihydrofolate reductase family protein [Verrucomicrobiae bacterium]|jgi:dihydrofolate reductase|nr:dihydrofolate reductase family protein [Verrucomicrobiae bacterium]
MRELIADLFLSLDGFASGMGEKPYFGCLGPELETWVRENLDPPQYLIMGRVTYTALAGFSANGKDEVSRKMKAIPKLVFSSTLKEPLQWENTQLVRGTLEHEIPQLKREGTKVLRSIGSISLVRSMIELNLVDRLRLMFFPVILGKLGREPAFANCRRTELELIACRSVDSRIMLVEYAPGRSRNR